MKLSKEEIQDRMKFVIDELTKISKDPEAPEHAKVKALSALSTAIRKYNDMFPESKGYTMKSEKNF